MRPVVLRKLVKLEQRVDPFELQVGGPGKVIDASTLALPYARRERLRVRLGYAGPFQVRLRHFAKALDSSQMLLIQFLQRSQLRHRPLTIGVDGERIEMQQIGHVLVAKVLVYGVLVGPVFVDEILERVADGLTDRRIAAADGLCSRRLL